ncbi:MAG: AAA family ATPase [Bacteroidota bacterium]|nr:AAA family ATPase [Bacteroidota bacterium]
MKKLPISKAVFKDLINENCCYVDKTSYVKILNDEPSKYFFFSRPRRFGKSLFLDTLRAAYSGERELFKSLYLDKHWNWAKKYPVINMTFGGGTVETKEELSIHLHSLLEDVAEKYGIVLNKSFIPDRFTELIKKLSVNYSSKVVVLIDEYDKPILDNITKSVSETMRDGLASFYSVLKTSEEYLKFVFLTGVSKFSKTSIFSKLNNIIDISLNPKFADMCGYTQEELDDVFKEYLLDVDMEKVKDWYNGYNFLGTTVYNPYDILLFLNDKKYKPYWFNTGTPTFLLDLIKEKKILFT